MVKEAYINPKISKILKNKLGGNILKDVDLWYDSGGSIVHEPHYNLDSLKRVAYTPCLTQQLAMRWLREVHKIYLHIAPFYGSPNQKLDKPKWMYGIDLPKGALPSSKPEFDTYEDCVDEAIKDALNYI